MRKLSIYAKSKTLLIKELYKHFDIEFLEEKSFVAKEITQNAIYPDVYFHSGTLDVRSMDLIQNCKQVIANSNSAKNDIVNKTSVDEDKVTVVYPAIKLSPIKAKEAKRQLCDELDISKKTRIIFFTARNLKTNGVKELFDILNAVSNDNYKVIIAGEGEQINTLKFQISKLKINDKVVFFEDFKNIDLLYGACDIFILPTYVKNFSINVLKAMSLKSAVFVSAHNSAREVVDVFATMESPLDPNTSFKVDALLKNKDELKLIKKQNAKAVKNFTVEKQIQKLISSLNIT